MCTLNATADILPDCSCLLWLKNCHLHSLLPEELPFAQSVADRKRQQAPEAPMFYLGVRGCLVQGLREKKLIESNLEKVDALKPIAEELGCSLAQLALAWCASCMRTPL